MPQGPHLIFDKSSLESLSVDESALLDNFYTCNITHRNDAVVRDY
jgi:hypothetical protein